MCGVVEKGEVKKGKGKEQIDFRVQTKTQEIDYSNKSGGFSFYTWRETSC